ncbi:uncharacterized protein LOC110059492 [Orbicella faveolata]|uniref:uncharacterized protein LOC110059492 n=1 Tax=Orbicella faveolata TaxID=48498 RepID=UPI0009E3E7A2|nr:uncharacterized protein LOC110059492 [Orbicella faveolata]
MIEKQFKVIFLCLREIKSVDKMSAKILLALNVCQGLANKQCDLAKSHLRSLTTKTILILDNAEDLLKLKENNELVVELQEELKNAQSYTKDFKQQILDLRDKLLEEQETTRKKEEFVAHLKRELNELVREKDLLALEKKCEHHATETAMNNAREMQKQAAKSAKDAGKNKGMSVIL